VKSGEGEQKYGAKSGEGCAEIWREKSRRPAAAPCARRGKDGEAPKVLERRGCGGICGDELYSMKPGGKGWK
jgi:hypothetical protein